MKFDDAKEQTLYIIKRIDERMETELSALQSKPETMNGIKESEAADAAKAAKREDRSDDSADKLLYSLTDKPPWGLCVLLGFQHYLTAFGSTLTVPLVLAGPLCVGSDMVGLAKLISTTFFVTGICTLLQVSLGIRLPIIQGPTFSFLVPTIAILTLPKWACPADASGTNSTIAGNYSSNLTDKSEMDDDNVIWHSRIREIQGAICVSAIFQIFIGVTGLLSFFLRHIGPLTITPTVTLIGLSLFEVAADKAATQWGIATLTIVLILVFSQYLRRFEVPVLSFSRGNGWMVHRIAIFRLMPILLAIGVSWFLCFILTITNALPEDSDASGYKARTDVKSDVIKDTSWVQIPYPGQWGTPTVSASAVFGMLAGVLASMMESIGDYYACAKLSGAPPPPPSAMNRGIAVEGFGCIIAGLFGTGNGTTSFSENVGAIGITRVASRRVVLVAAVLIVVLGCVGKVGAIFVTLPDPVVGGMFLTMFGMITAVGLSNLQYVDLNSPRNLFIVALSLFLGLSFPHWMSKNQGLISTGNVAVDQIIEVLLGTSMFIGGIIGFVLDLTIPGTLEERGILKMKAIEESVATPSQGDNKESRRSLYSIPCIQKWLDKVRLFTFIPICPSSDNRSQTPKIRSDSCHV